MSTTDEPLVAALLGAHDLPADPRERRGLTAVYRAQRPAVAAMYTVAPNTDSPHDTPEVDDDRT
ncbi:hypothetical protein [Stackebrandtia nassauensis]|uniref:Uncharacterized protein n=1 Tax=Stackebrandtia nassauensis (strain DSM 44728 / CIP 108903 / NRRL B-16338 / NBRC 102104 / LLR-40K-21) TaxID=446470 RepID=D3PUD0_STANL|nr:hypothetical protein [Stackebrandtia nassauensis]ADD42943.1 hypothetical protein Snas_3273 [Stackebrandtia nassauensis DSM 44728]